MARKGITPIQGSFFSDKISRCFGGSQLSSNPKTARPLTTKDPLHIVLKARNGFGSRSMLHPDHAKKIDSLIRSHAKKNGIRIYHLVNVGNHIHLIIRIFNRRLYSVFMRTIAGLIARLVLKRERGNAKEKELNSLSHHQPTSYWLRRPFSRIAHWGKDYRGLCSYMRKNQTQAERFSFEKSYSIQFYVVGFDNLAQVGATRDTG